MSGEKAKVVSFLWQAFQAEVLAHGGNCIRGLFNWALEVAPDCLDVLA